MVKEDGRCKTEEFCFSNDILFGIGVIYLEEGDYDRLTKKFERFLLKYFKENM
jgi:hypothetical protein